MFGPLPPSLEAVLAVSSRGGFRAAARELGISSSYLSQQIAALEARMGVRLFNRSTRSVVLSAAGEQFVASVAPALEAIRNAVEHVDEHRAEATGTLRINTSGGGTRMILTPLILEYMRRNPQMAVEIVTEGALVDVNAKGFDAGIRIREAVPPDMVVVPIGDTVRPAIVGSVDYLPAMAGLRFRPTFRTTCASAPGWRVARSIAGSSKSEERASRSTFQASSRSTTAT